MWEDRKLWGIRENHFYDYLTKKNNRRMISYKLEKYIQK